MNICHIIIILFSTRIVIYSLNYHIWEDMNWLFGGKMSDRSKWIWEIKLLPLYLVSDVVHLVDCLLNMQDALGLSPQNHIKLGILTQDYKPRSWKRIGNQELKVILGCIPSLRLAWVTVDPVLIWLQIKFQFCYSVDNFTQFTCFVNTVIVMTNKWRLTSELIYFMFNDYHMFFDTG